MSESQSDSLLICKNCQISFDLEMRIPKLLPCCRKTICKKCAQKLPPNSDRRCPLCREKLDRSLKFESNDQIIDQTIERMKASKWEKCPEHGNKIKFYCKEENTKICSDCLYIKNPDCQEHERSHIKNLRPKAERRRRTYEDMLDDVENHYTRFQDELVGSRKSMEEMICKHFDENISKLERNKLKTLHIFNKSCAEEKKEFEMHFGEESSLRNELRAIISDHIDFRKIKEPIEALRDEYRTLHSKVNYLTRDDNNVLSFEKQLSNISQSLQRQLKKQEVENERTWGDFMTYITGEMKTQGLPGFNGTRDGQFVEKPHLKITSNLEFILKDGTLSIDEQGSIKQEFSFPKDKLQRVSKISFVFKDLDIENEDWEVLSKLINKVLTNRDSSLSLYFRSESNEYSAAKISRLFAIFFQNPPKIVSLEMNLYLNKDSIFLLHLILLQLSNLKSLALTFRRKIFQMESFDSFIQSLIFLAPRLESLKLHFPKNQIKVSELQKLQNIFMKMPILKKFDLDFSQIPCLDKQIFASFARKFDELMPQLQEVLINVTGTKVGVSFVSYLQETLEAVIPKVEVRNRELLNGNNGSDGSLERSELQRSR